MDLSWTEFAGLGAALGLLAVLVVVLKSKEKDVEIAIHEWAGTVATAFAKAGFSHTICAPLQALAAGNLAGCVSAGVHLAEYLKDVKNWEKECLSVLQTALADPVLGPKVRKLCGDIAANADQKTIQADADDLEASSPLDALTKANQALEDSMHDALHSAQHPELEGLIAKLPKGRKSLAGFIVAGKHAAQKAQQVTETVLQSGTLLASALPTIPDGHILLGPGATLPPAPTSDSAGSGTGADAPPKSAA